MFVLPDYGFLPLKWLAIAIVFIVFMNLIYFTTLSVFGLIKPKRDYEMAPDTKRFVFVVPAHNEEDVIGATVESILNQNYNSDLYDLVVIADNCTDKTIDILNTYEGVTTVINQSGPDEPRGKPHAIAKYVDTLHWQNYDYIAFIDADNIVSQNYLTEMNSQMIAHPEFTVIQGYLGMKNVRTSLTALGYAAVYFITNRAVQAANYYLGWNAAIGGTGFILDTTYLQQHGWNPRSYTEDFELQVELSIRGARSGWNHFAVVYDEKPDTLIASHNQRTRWSQGHWFVAFTTSFRQIRSLFKSKSLQETLSKLETLVYSYSMVRPVAMMTIIFLSLIDRRILIYLPDFFSLLTFWMCIQIFNFLIIPTVYFLQEANRYFSNEKTFFYKLKFFSLLVVAFIYNSVTYMAAQLVGFFTWFFPQNNWKKTVHKAHFDS